MLAEKLKKFQIILASGSPRRQLFFKELGVDFVVQLIPVEEIYPNHLKGLEIANYIAQLKASVYTNIRPKDILITSDTIVWHQDKALGKPTSSKDAFAMLQSLSGSAHQVITSVCFTTTNQQITLADTTKVWFKKLTDEEINYYIEKYNPLDKAGAYGIQEWIGSIGITKIKGSYNTVMGLPTHLVYKTLMKFASQ
ncbi:MAG: septum formation protein Maf [Flavobacteriaceae bacterium CG_4_8_14_3_um_filter_34_10]|nr:septum formation protein Maf [Flavobacteriia bacterium]OIP52761.1 MAG: septum formation protein Maf [Flavobacteriaceae bacterium CG2_30_34_30]PIQ17717.1 MAG: septum formation protein Maf [Flavobacteriaceae bacterium CG18_big_fil_WC_8_21_14_2_50_34_36]PIV50325.1 MAG: septum formation protein Maf [Flavobacteriaceae bacterium CG02_land_8_20_14_3_00_34_13]PIX09533.1 MAG: septum formation protein Maf [Flavobacteriaceae bacterium CG_4_8_14_3_um_filter_34_10]PJC08558.1 MAG: septum formation protei